MSFFGKLEVVDLIKLGWKVIFILLDKPRDMVKKSKEKELESFLMKVPPQNLRRQN